MKKTSSFDRLWIGFVVGLLLPILVFYLYYLISYSTVHFGAYIMTLHISRLLFKVISLCVLADLPVFHIALQLKWMRTSRGIVMACFLFAFSVLLYRVFV